MNLKEPNTYKINILGEEWLIVLETSNKKFDTLSGYCDCSKKEIHIELLNDIQVRKQIIRHEVIHAFLYESGLDSQSTYTDSWATNEEMVDWIAIQFHKISKVFKELKI